MSLSKVLVYTLCHIYYTLWHL